MVWWSAAASSWRFLLSDLSDDRSSFALPEIIDRSRSLSGRRITDATAPPSPSVRIRPTKTSPRSSQGGKPGPKSFRRRLEYLPVRTDVLGISLGPLSSRTARRLGDEAHPAGYCAKASTHRALNGGGRGALLWLIKKVLPKDKPEQRGCKAARARHRR